TAGAAAGSITSGAAAADGTAKAGGLLTRWLMQLRKSRQTQTITMGTVAAVACAILAWAMAGGGRSTPQDAAPPPVIALPAPSPTIIPPKATPPPPPVVVPTHTPQPTHHSTVMKPPPPRPRPTPPTTPTPTPPKPTPTPTAPTTPPPPAPTPPPPTPRSSEPSPEPPQPSEPSEPSEPSICDWAQEASQHPDFETIGLIIGAEWDPDCDHGHWIPWVPHHPHPSSATAGTPPVTARHAANPHAHPRR
ncbi:MAG: hypothetical protein HOW97_18510, partial [Catenulispora sp.]|nr:hypothetical protein [Catenulispora sp.]